MDALVPTQFFFFYPHLVFLSLPLYFEDGPHIGICPGLPGLGHLAFSCAHTLVLWILLSISWALTTLRRSRRGQLSQFQCETERWNEGLSFWSCFCHDLWLCTNFFIFLDLKHFSKLKAELFLDPRVSEPLRVHPMLWLWEYRLFFLCTKQGCEVEIRRDKEVGNENENLVLKPDSFESGVLWNPPCWVDSSSHLCAYRVSQSLQLEWPMDMGPSVGMLAALRLADWNPRYRGKSLEMRCKTSI